MSSARKFSDRTEAGERLGDALRDREVNADVVLAIPRGGLPLGRAVADALDAPLDVVVASKIGAPGNPEYAIGAVASDGTVWRNEDAIRRTGADEAYVEHEREQEAAVAQEKAERYRADRPELDLAGKRVVVVDDGVATGATARACLQLLEAADAERVVLALPVGPPDTIAQLQALADDVVCLRTPSAFRGVGQFYERFDQVSDEDAIAYLHEDD
jgi:predicted phosphoribosyltransferase